MDGEMQGRRTEGAAEDQVVPAEYADFTTDGELGRRRVSSLAVGSSRGPTARARRLQQGPGQGLELHRQPETSGYAVMSSGRPHSDRQPSIVRDRP